MQRVVAILYKVNPCVALPQQMKTLQCNLMDVGKKNYNGPINIFLIVPN